METFRTIEIVCITMSLALSFWNFYYAHFARPRLKLVPSYEEFDYEKDLHKVFTEPVHNLVIKFVSTSSKPITINKVECTYSNEEGLPEIGGHVFDYFIHNFLKPVYGLTLLQSQIAPPIRINDSRILKYLDSVCVVSSYGHRYYIDKVELKKVLNIREEKITQELIRNEKAKL